MLSEKLAMSLSEKQLRQLISKQGKAANQLLKELKTSGAAELSGVYTRKYIPYLKQHGTKKGGFYTRPAKSTNKETLVNQLLNIQYFNSTLKSVEHVKQHAAEVAQEYNFADEDELKGYWKLVRYGMDACGYRVDSDTVQKIVRERMRAGQTTRGIKRAITLASKDATSGDDYITKLSKGGVWL